MAALTQKQKEFLTNPFVAAATTLREDGSPHTTVVWVDSEDGGLIFNTARGHAKERHLSLDPRVSLLVLDPQNPWRWLSANGKVELTEQGADADIDRLSKKYLGKDAYPWRKPDETRVTAKVTPDRIETVGIDD
jgi:PPOX class probable F420-dependent enzyme